MPITTLARTATRLLPHAYKGDHKWHQCPQIQDHMGDVRAITRGARKSRRGLHKTNTHTTVDVQTSSEDSALSSAGEEAFAEHPQESERKFPMQEWIADTGASTHTTDQLHLFRGP